MLGAITSVQQRLKLYSKGQLSGYGLGLCLGARLGLCPWLLAPRTCLSHAWRVSSVVVVVGCFVALGPPSPSFFLSIPPPSPLFRSLLLV